MEHAVEDLFLRFRDDRDMMALSALVERLEPVLLRSASGFEADVEQIQDAVQQTFLIAIEKADVYEEGRPLTPWLRGILARQIRSHRGERVHGRLVVEPAADLPAAERSAHHREVAAMVASAVASMPRDYREVLLLRVQEGLSPAEIASILGRPRSTIRTQLSRALDLVRETLPAGITLAMLGIYLPRRGLAATRARVLARGAARHGVRPRSRRTFAAAFSVGAVLLVTLFVVWPDDGRSPLEGPGSGDGAALVTAPRRTSGDDNEETADRAVGSAVEASPVLAADAAAARSAAATIRVTLRRETDHAPVPHAAILYLDGTAASARVLTDADGRALLTVRSPAPNKSITVVAGRVYPRPMGHDVIVNPGEETELVIDVPHGCTVNGRVVDASGRAAPGADVWLGVGESNGAVVCQADASGRFCLPCVPESFFIAARSPSASQSRLRPIALGEDAVSAVDLELRLGGPAGQVDVRVVDADGRPLKSRLVLGPPLNRGIKELLDGPEQPPFTAWTDPEGRHRFRGIAPGRHDISARSRGLAMATGSVVVRPGEDASITLTVYPGARFVGEVLDEQDEGIAGAMVIVGRPEHPVYLTTATDRYGAFTLEGVPPGEHPVRVQTDVVDRVSEARFGFASGATTEWEVVLPGPPRSLAGRVVDARGRPLADCHVTLLTAAVDFNGHAGRMQFTDNLGRFRFRACNPDWSYRLEFRDADTELLGYRDGVRVFHPPLEMEVGEPLVADATLAFDRRRVAPEGLDVASLDCVHGDFIRSPEERVVADGLIPGRYVVRTFDENGRQIVRGPFTIEAGKVTDVGFLEDAPDASGDVVVIETRRGGLIAFDLDGSPGRTRGRHMRAPFLGRYDD